MHVAEGALALFNRTISYVNIADGTKKVTSTLGSKGPLNATHTEHMPYGTGSAYSAWAKSLVQSYSVLDNKPPPASVTAA